MNSDVSEAQNNERCDKAQNNERCDSHSDCEIVDPLLEELNINDSTNSDVSEAENNERCDSHSEEINEVTMINDDQEMCACKNIAKLQLTKCASKCTLNILWRET
ncbi:hypothetical protein Avbf_06399 [Armadillidium vulgare]|nr:hypothetical protein Avbf_06399 [Armadillidium vulgare]